MPSDHRAKLLGLLEKKQEIIDAANEQARLLDLEVLALIAGGETIGMKLRTLRGVYVTGWEARYLKACVYTDAENNRHLKSFLAQGLTVEDLSDRIRVYLASDDPFYVKVRHAFRNFVDNINSFVGLPLPPSERAVGCAHVPPCDSAAAHTERSMRELRS